MSEQRAEQLIVVSLFVFLASELGSYLATGKKGEHLPPQAKKSIGRRLVGGFLTMLFASLTALAAPEVGALLAISVASYAFLHDGLPAINKGYAQKPQTGKRGGTSQGESLKETPSPVETIAPTIAETFI